MDNQRVIETLKKVPLFENLNKKNLDLISRVTTLRHFDKDEVILKQGENGIGFFMIESGKVEVFRQTNDQKVKLAELGTGDFFGEMALFEDTPRSATVVTTEPTDCYVLTAWNFKGTMENAPTIAVQMLPVIIRRLQKTQELL